MTTLLMTLDLVGTSKTVITDAVNNAFEEASKTVKNIKWENLGVSLLELKKEKR